MDRYDLIAQDMGFPSIVGPIKDTERDIEDYSPVVSQLAITCLGLALERLWRSWGIAPQAVIGHSLGEYTALYCAGVLTEHDTIFLVGKRARLLEQCCTPRTHSMLAVEASIQVTERLIDGLSCEIACVNGPDEVLLSGPISKIKEVSAVFRSHQIKATVLQTSYAFHSSQVEPILTGLDNESKKVCINNPKVPMVSATLAAVVKDKESFASKYFSTHCRGRVNLLQAVQAAQTAHVLDQNSVLMEIGHQPVVSRLVSVILKPAFPCLASL